MGAGQHIQIADVSGQRGIETAARIGRLVPEFHFGDVRPVDCGAQVVDEGIEKRIGTGSQYLQVENREIHCARGDGPGHDVVHGQVGGPARLDGLDARVSKGGRETSRGEDTTVEGDQHLDRVAVDGSRGKVHRHEQLAIRRKGKTEGGGILPSVRGNSGQDPDERGLGRGKLSGGRLVPNLNSGDVGVGDGASQVGNGQLVEGIGA